VTPEYVVSLAIVFVLSLGLSIALTLFARRLAPRLRLVSRPGGRRKEQQPIPKMGALPLWGAFTISVLAAQLLPVPRQDPNEVIRLTGLLLGGTFMAIMGTLDDRFELAAVPQFAAQFIAAFIAIACLIFIERFNNPITGEMTTPWPFFITILISLFWLVLMMNTVNWLDGVDGLAAGVNVIAAVLLFIHTFNQGQLSVSLLPMALIGAALGFLIFNWFPASIYLGGGAPYLGFTIGALSIIGGAKMATILLVMGLPLLDVAWQIARRAAMGKNPLIGDRGHLHFRLVDGGFSPRLLVIGYYIFCTAFGLLALLTTSRLFKLIALVVMIGLIIAGFALVGRWSDRRATTQQKSEG